MKRKVLAVWIILSFILFTACSDGAENTSAENQKLDPNVGIVVYVGGTIFDSSLDPIKGAMSYGYSFTNCALTRVNSDSEYEGDMATDWEISEDGLRYTFHLREGITFSDGSDLTAEDVVFTYNTVKENQANNENVDLTKLAKAEAEGDDTVTFTLSKPYSPFLDATAALGIVPSDAYDSATFDQYPIGTGPWVVSQYDSNQQIIVTANEKYYEGAPAIKKVTFVSMESEAAFSSAQSGQLNIVMVGPNYAVEEVPGMSIEKFETMDIRMMSLPVRAEQTMKNEEGEEVLVGNNVTSDLNVRKALSLGIDRGTIIQNAFNGVGKPAMSFTDNLIWSYAATWQDNQKEEAKKILENSGWVDSDGDGIREKDGDVCQFDVYAPGEDKDRFLLASAVAEDAAELGIRINVKTASWDEVLTLQNTASIVWGWGQYSPTVLNSLFESGLFLSGGYDNVVGYQNTEVDQAIENAFLSTTQEEAVSNWKTVQKVANEDFPYLYLVNIEHCYFISDGLNVSIDTQIPHPHGHGSPIICNMKDWTIE